MDGTRRAPVPSGPDQLTVLTNFVVQWASVRSQAVDTHTDILLDIFDSITTLHVGLDRARHIVTWTSEVGLSTIGSKQISVVDNR